MNSNCSFDVHCNHSTKINTVIIMNRFITMLAVFGALFIMGCDGCNNEIESEFAGVICDIKTALDSEDEEQINKAFDGFIDFAREHKDDTVWGEDEDQLLENVNQKVKANCGSDYMTVMEELGMYIAINDPEKIVEMMELMEELE